MINWKKALSFGLAFLLIGTTAPLFSTSVAQAEPTGENYYVSTTGSNETGDGSFESPWRTIQRAADDMQAGDTAIIRGGVYRETVTPANSGTADKPIIFKSYENESVTINGADLVTGWVNDEGNIAKAPMAWSLGSGNQIFVNGTMVDEARWPNNTGGLMNPTRATADNGSFGTLVDSDLPFTAGELTGAKIWYLGGKQWIANSRSITDYDAAAHEISFATAGSPNVNYDAENGTLYYVYGSRQLLDTQNEWWLDESADELHLWAPGSVDPATVTVEAKKRLYGMNLSGKSNIHITNIDFFATSIQTDSQTNGMRLQGITAQYVSHDFYERGTATSTANGILIQGTDNEIVDSEFAYSSAGLLTIEGSNNRVMNSYLRDANYGGTWSGLLSLNGKELYAAYNTIENAGRDGLQIRNIQHSLIEHNRVKNALLLTTDGAGIYTANTDGMGTEIRYNIVSDVQAYHGIGIYFDNYSSNFLAHHNIVRDTSLSPVLMNTPNNTLLVFNNTFVNHGRQNAKAPAEDQLGSRMYNNIFTDELVVGASTTLGMGFNVNALADQLFEDPEGEDYRLKAESLAIDKGKVIAGITDGYQGIAPDAGALEYGEPMFKAGHDFANPPAIGSAQFAIQPFLNYVVNGDFETGDLSGWTAAGDVTMATGDAWGKADGGDIKYHKFGAKLGQDGRIEQTVTGLQPDTDYLFGVWAKAENEHGSITLGVGTPSRPSVEQAVYSQTWTRELLPFRTGAAETSALIYALGQSDSGEAEGASETHLADVAVPQAGTTLSAYVTSFVQQEYAGDQIVSFLLKLNSPTEATFVQAGSSSLSPRLRIVTEQGTEYTFFMTEDSYVNIQSKNQNYDNSEIYLSNAGAKYKEGYIKIDLRDVVLDSPIAQARIMLRPTWVYKEGTATEVVLSVSGLGTDDWDAETITWNNKPLIASTATAGYVDGMIVMLPINNNSPREELLLQLSPAITLYNSASILVPVGAKSIFEDLIDEAGGLLEDPLTDDEPFEQMLLDLQAGMVLFQAQNTLALEMATAIQMVADAEERAEDYYYPIGSRAVLQAAIDQAGDVLENLSADTAAVEGERAALQQSIADFLNSLQLPDIAGLAKVNMNAVLNDLGQYSSANMIKEGEFTRFSANATRYKGQQYRNELFEFDMTYTFVGGGEYPGFLLRSQRSDNAVMWNGDTDYLLIFKQDSWEVQKWVNSSQPEILATYPNTLLTESGQLYRVTVGAVDTPIGVRLLFYVNGQKGFDMIDRNDPLEADGYFGAISIGDTGNLYLKGLDVPNLDLRAPYAATAGEPFTVGIGLSSLGQSALSEVGEWQATLHYDDNVLRYDNAAVSADGVQIASIDTSVDGRIVLSIADTTGGGMTSDGKLLDLTFTPVGGLGVATITMDDVAFTGASGGTWLDGMPGSAAVYVLEAEATGSYRVTAAGPDRVVAGEVFDVTWTMSSVTDSVYALDQTIQYDPTRLDLIAVTSLKSGLAIDWQAGDPGQVLLLMANAAAGGGGAITETTPYLQMRFQAKVAAASTSSSVSAAALIVSNGDGHETIGTIGPVYTVDIIFVDKTALQLLIDSAQDLHDGASEGTGIGQYPEGTKTTLQAAINDAQGVADGAEVTEEQVSDAADLLQSAINTFLASMNVPATGDLNQDGRISVGDLGIVAATYGKKAGDADWDSYKRADVTGDGKVDIEDLSTVAQWIRG